MYSRSFITRARLDYCGYFDFCVGEVVANSILLFLLLGGLKMPLCLGFCYTHAHRTHNSFLAPKVFPFLLVSLLCYAICDEVHALNTWPLKQYKNATVVLKSSEEKQSNKIEFDTQRLTIFNSLKLNASISGEDEDSFDVLSELDAAMDDIHSLASEMLQTELEFGAYATNEASCKSECAKGNHCCNYDKTVGSSFGLTFDY